MLPSDALPPQVTILTPTWNRRQLLPRLFQSLVAQQAPPGSFEWLVVDDGSTDGSAEWLETLIAEAGFPIRVIRQENGGKHRALNRGAKELSTPWVLIVDSDDWLLPDAMKTILEETASATSAVLAIIAPLALEGLPPRSFRPPGRTVCFAEWLAQSQVGDTSIVMRSGLLRDYPFPEFEGEKFIAESSVYAKMFIEGGIQLVDNQIVGAEYQPDGLTARSLHLRVDNPLGAIATYNAQLKAGLACRESIKANLNLHRFFCHALLSQRNLTSYGLRPNLLWLALGWVLYLMDRRKLNWRK